MMMTKTLFLVAVALAASLLMGTTGALSPAPPTRRGFLEKAVGASIAAASVTAAGVKPTNAAAATVSSKVYQPDLNSLSDKVIVITGGSSGLGLESAKRLASAGATTVLTTRSDAKGVKAVSEVQSYLQERSIDNSNVYFLTLDLDDLDSVRSFPQQLQAKLGKETKIDVLLNNAGVAAIPTREVTKDGFERTFQSNHLGPFLLTSLLFPLLNQQKGARIINVSSLAHQKFSAAGNGNQGLDLENLNGELEYLSDGWQSYGRSKLENVLFTQELQKRADQKNMDWLSVSSLHPGVVATDVWRSSLVRKGGSNPLQSLSSQFFYNFYLVSPEEGANTQVWLASQLDPKIGRGQYYDENGKLPELDDFAKDPKAAEMLWKRSEELLGIQFRV